MKRRLLPIILGLAACLALGTATAFAADVEGSKAASPTDLTKDQRQTEVTLSLPSAEYRYMYDVVFVLDASSSTEGVFKEFNDCINDLYGIVSEKDADVKIGVVKFRGVAADAIYEANGDVSGLVQLGADTKEAIEAGINFDIKNSNLRAGYKSSGTNIHGGLTMANDMLAADTDVADDHKYVILLTDGKTYIWDEDGTATSIYSHYYRNHKIQTGTAVSIAQVAGCDKGSYPQGDSSMIVAFEKSGLSPDEIFSALYNSTNTELTSVNSFDTRAGYAYGEGSSASTAVTKYPTTNGAELFPVAGYEDYRSYYETTAATGYEGKLLDANPYVATANGDGTYTFDSTQPNPNFYMYHVSGLEKATYKSAHLWSDMVDTYNCAAVYDNTWSLGGGLHASLGFANWLGEVSDFSAKKSDTSGIGAMLDSISEEILYMAASGVVTDQIPSEFTLVDDSFTCTKGGEALTVTAAGDNTWNVGEAVEGTYPYTIAYDPDNKIITWTINVPVENANPVALSYTLEIAKGSRNGNHDTNVSAFFDYTSTTGETGTFTFDVPVVTYTEKYKVTYVVNEDDTYGVPADSKTPKAKEYNLNDNVTVADDLTTGQDYAIDPETGEKVPGEWTFESWDTEDFQIDKDTVITGAWKFTADVDDDDNGDFDDDSDDEGDDNGEGNDDIISPETGDNTTMLPGMIIMAVGALGIAISFIVRRRSMI